MQRPFTVQQSSRMINDRKHQRELHSPFTKLRSPAHQRMTKTGARSGLVPSIFMRHTRSIQPWRHSMQDLLTFKTTGTAYDSVTQQLLEGIITSVISRLPSNLGQDIDPRYKVTFTATCLRRSKTS